MRYLVGLSLGVAAVALFASSCNGNSNNVAASTGPSISITSPQDGDMVSGVDSNPDVPVSFTVKNFILRDQGQCAGLSSCGQVQVFVDGTSCNDPTPLPYNNIGSSSPIDAGLDYCPTLLGDHTITVQLVLDDGTVVADAKGNAIADSVTIMAMAGAPQDDGGVPPQQDGGAAAVCPDGSDPVAASSVTVADFSFSPKCIKVSAGTTVTWHNTGMPIHTVTSDAGAPVTFNSGALGSGGSFQFTFTDPGTVGYHCIPHQAFGMVGTVIVE
jgi:plastocyanin